MERANPTLVDAFTYSVIRTAQDFPTLQGKRPLLHGINTAMHQQDRIGGSLLGILEIVTLVCLGVLAEKALSSTSI